MRDGVSGDATCGQQLCEVLRYLGAQRGVRAVLADIGKSLDGCAANLREGGREEREGEKEEREGGREGGREEGAYSYLHSPSAKPLLDTFPPLPPSLPPSPGRSPPPPGPAESP